jgi:hypothetical protein
MVERWSSQVAVDELDDLYDAWDDDLGGEPRGRPRLRKHKPLEVVADVVEVQDEYGGKRKKPRYEAPPHKRDYDR